MSHSFSFDLSSDPEYVINVVKSHVVEGGGTFTGDRSAGSFSGSGVAGSYHVQGKTVTILITKKPFLAPMSIVEGRIKSYFKVI
jgi:hypothetical protein